MGEEEVLNDPSTAEEARADGPDRDAEDLGGGLVRLLLDVDEHERGAEGRGDVLQGALDGRQEVGAVENVLEGSGRRRVGE